MTIVQNGAINPAALTVPNLYVQIQPPQNNIINGVPSNILGLVGTATWGPVNSPKTIGSLSDYVQAFGQIQTNKYDMGTHLATAFLQGANNFRCVRVTDGTDAAATALLLDTTSPTAIGGVLLTAFYTGTVGNTLVATVSSGSNSTIATPTYKLTIALPNMVPEIFDNIGGSGNTLWQNMVNAVNLGQNGIRGPSQYVVATLAKGIGAINVTNAGTGYTSIPTVGFTGGGGGSGATAVAIMKALTVSVAGGGSGYNVGDTVTLAGGTNTQPIVLTVSTVSAGVITAVTITTAGKYSALPTNPVSQATTSGSGTGATFSIDTWGVDSVRITASGTGYTSAPTVSFTGGAGSGAAATAVVGSVAAPNATSYTLSGGTNGNTTISGSSLLGQDTTPRTGMYALRGTGASVVVLCDCDDSTTWSNQIAYGLAEGSYMVLVGLSGESISSAVTAKQTAGIDSYAAKLLLGDYCYFKDTINNQVRLVSPQGFFAGMRVNQLPSEGSLNKPILGIVGTQKTSANQVYSDAELGELANAGIDVITNPSPGGNYFSCRIGRNTSSSVVVRGDNYTMMTNFIAKTLNSAMGIYIGQLQTTSERTQARNTIQSFLRTLEQNNMIGDVNGGPAFSVVLDETNNPSTDVAKGIQKVDVQIVYLSVIEYFIINVQGGQSVTIQRQSTQSLAQAA